MERVGRVYTVGNAGDEARSLADEVWRSFGGRFPFPALLRLIREKGVRAVREHFVETQKADAGDRLALFLWRVGKNRVRWG